MGDVVHLNRFRKKKAKAEKERRAEHNRRLHGRTKAERARDEFEADKQRKLFAGLRLSPEVKGTGVVPDAGGSTSEAGDDGAEAGEEGA